VRTTVLIVDDDLGFVFWLGRSLDAAGYRSLPAKSITDATILLEELNIQIDLLIVNPSLPGAGGFISRLRRSPGSVKVIAVSDLEKPVTTPSGVDVWRRKFQGPVDSTSGLEWLQLVSGILSDNSVKS